MSYENAPATKMLATHCCACARPLLDAASVTAGLGPHCRAKHGVPNDLDEETRERANKLIFECAQEHVDAEVLKAAVVELALLGCAKLADRISKRAGRIVFTVTDEHVDVKAPYSEAFLSARGPGRWVRDAKVTRYATADAAAALAAVRSAFGDTALVRLEGHDAVAFWNASDETLVAFVDALVERAPKPEPAPEITLAGTPYKTRAGQWGVTLPENAEAKAGDLVVVTARSGKRWVARLVGAAEVGPRGIVFATERTDLSVPASAPASAPAPAPREVQWEGSPTKLRGGWAVKIRFGHDALDGKAPKAGDLVRVTARSGKSWVATLSSDARVNRYRDAWVAETAR
jgi:hypothetical protein